MSVSAPFVAVAGPSAPSTPVVANAGTPQGRNNAQIEDIASAAPVTSPVRKQRRVTRASAPFDGHQQDDTASSAAAVRPATPRPPVNTGAGDDVAAGPCCSMMQGLLGNARGAQPSYKEADTEDLTTELIRRVRQAEPFTEEEHLQRRRQRGLEAFDAICEIARELKGTTAPPVAKAAAKPAEPIVDAFNTILDIARELRGSAPPAVLPPVSRTTGTTAAGSVSGAIASTSGSDRSVDTRVTAG